VFRLLDTEAEATQGPTFFTGSAPQPTMQQFRAAASFVEQGAVIANAIAACKR